MTTTQLAVVTMTLSKETAGTYVYQEPNVPGKFFPTVYIQKNKLGTPPPQRIRVTVEVAD